MTERPLGRGYPVDPETRSRVLNLYRAGSSRNAIAREIGISGSTVSSIVVADGGTFDRTQTALAIEARRIDMAVERAEIARMLLVRGREALEAMDQPATVHNWSREGVFDEQVIDRPTFSDQRNLMTIAAIAVQRHADLVKVDAGRDAEQGRSMVTDLRDQLTVLIEGGADALPDPTLIESEAT